MVQDEFVCVEEEGKRSRIGPSEVGVNHSFTHTQLCLSRRHRTGTTDTTTIDLVDLLTDDGTTELRVTVLTELTLLTRVRQKLDKRVRRVKCRRKRRTNRRQHAKGGTTAHARGKLGEEAE